MKRSDIEV